MQSTGDPHSWWTYEIDFSTLTITPGAYAITVGGRDLSGNLYSSLEGVLDGDETSTDKIEIDFQKFIPTITVSDVTRTFGDPNFDLTATSTSTGTLTFERLISSCSFISVTPAGDVTINGAGTCRIKVSQAANPSFQSGVEYLSLIHI